ncbi:hypothetical protein R3P38DRAFT_2936181 [Favolaschia claudopus]|uniref:Uncharacterized protein n=1 Tax=Favolaschia claudopus TaxID=2862362 RepID=A0AAW0BMG2_9AGAR
MTDADVRAMAHAWRLLTALVITPPRANELHHQMGWDDSTADGEESESRRSLSGHSVVMEELTLFSSPCGDKPLLVADFLNRAFPRLPERAFHVYWSGEGQDGRRRWDVVAEALGHP